MSVVIARADFAEPQLATFLEAHLADLAHTAPDEDRHALDLGALQRPTVRLWVARDGAELVGTAALSEVEPGHEELKSMRTAPARRGYGIGRRLLAHVLDDARARGVERISLETGTAEFFVLARTFYARAGFVSCMPFGSYVESPHSTYLTLALV